MSSALAAAKKRRAFGETTNTIKPVTPPPTPTPTTSENTNKPMTINQAFRAMNERINVLDKKVSDEQSNPVITDSIINEYEQRFEMILNEIVNIKDTLMKLQTFSMEVNKSLHDERIQLLTDVDSSNVPEIDHFHLDEEDTNIALEVVDVVTPDVTDEVTPDEDE
jgi:hypothetical protein